MVKPNGKAPAYPPPLCILCQRVIDPKREDAPSNAAIKAHKHCVGMK